MYGKAKIRPTNIQRYLTTGKYFRGFVYSLKFLLLNYKMAIWSRKAMQYTSIKEAYDVFTFHAF